MNLPISPGDYYDDVPSLDHQPGDVWAGLPAYGVLPEPPRAALVITPACDLLNRKVETVSYLPVLSVHRYLVSRSFLPEILRALDGQLQAAGMPGRTRPAGAALPALPDMELFASFLSEKSSSVGISTKETSACAKATAGIRLASRIVSGGAIPASILDLRSLLGDGDFQAVLRKLVTNSLRHDLHFLPPDEQPAEYSLLTDPSLVLFRYPLTIPIDLLDLATSVAEPNWLLEAARLTDQYPCAVALPRRPMKHLRVRPRFLADLLSRFTSLYGRIGSPDFSPASVDRYVSRLGGAE